LRRDGKRGSRRPVGEGRGRAAVVDRITSWQDGAPEETVRNELLRGLAEAQVDVPADFVEEVVRRVRGGSEHFDVEPLLNNE
jgi:malonyl CoA-acyl carrier protein transacylase